MLFLLTYTLLVQDGIEGKQRLGTAASRTPWYLSGTVLLCALQASLLLQV